ncbi:hypothetical protein phi1422_0075 [Bdellovibrio phage phi1422]|uniref:hypothetical protein n=1 Tax=Bdellovibrio phage phi1422 TaxID=1127515 RepID=UPI0002536D9A|nr:hypothetical protein F395_gp75 [Bdellovibrio phage phi1422]AFC22595.1 hypothetical protein phi1422_0075 [Bdellovibrio phage phi1422]
MKSFAFLFILLFGFLAQASFWIPDGSVTNKKLAPMNISSSASVMYTSTSPSPIPIVNITTTGRPVLFQLMPADITGGTIGTQPGSVLIGTVGAGTFAGAIFSVNRGGSPIRSMRYEIGGASGNISSVTPCASFSYIDETAPAGVNSYSFSVSGVTGLFQVSYCKIVVREL